MKLYIVIAVLALLLLAMLVVGCLKLMSSRERRRKAHEQQLASERLERQRVGHVKQWIDRIQAATSYQQAVAIGPFTPLSTWDNYWEYFARKVEGYDEAKSRYEDASWARNYANAAGDDWATLELLIQFKLDIVRFPSRFDLGVRKDELEDAIHQLIEVFRAQAETGESFAVERFNKLRESNSSQRWYRLSSSGRKPEGPPNWNELVAVHFRTPTVQMFDGFSGEPEPGTVRLLAARALDERSLRLGKVVLAYCSIRIDVEGSGKSRSRQAVWPYRQETGDVLLAEVTKMVHSIHVEQNLFV